MFECPSVACIVGYRVLQNKDLLAAVSPVERDEIWKQRVKKKYSQKICTKNAHSSFSNLKMVDEKVDDF